MAEIHVDELFAEVPAGLVCTRDRVVHQALRLDRLGSCENFLIGRRHTDTGCIENVLAIEQMLGVRHESDCHDLAVDGDQLRLGQIAAMLGNEAVERTGKAVIHQCDERAVGDDRAGELGRVGSQRRDLAVLVIGVQVNCYADPAAITGGSGAGYGLNRREVTAGDAHGTRADTATRIGARRAGEHECRGHGKSGNLVHLSLLELLFRMKGLSPAEPPLVKRHLIRNGRSP